MAIIVRKNGKVIGQYFKSEIYYDVFRMRNGMLRGTWWCFNSV